MGGHQGNESSREQMLILEKEALSFAGEAGWVCVKLF